MWLQKAAFHSFLFMAERESIASGCHVLLTHPSVHGCLLPADLGDCRLFCSEHWFRPLFPPFVWESEFFFAYSFRSVIAGPIGRDQSVFVFIFSEGATFKPLPS